MDWKLIVALPLMAGLGLAGIVLQPPAAAFARRWLAYPWWAAALAAVPIACIGVGAGLCVFLRVSGRLPLVSMLVGVILGGIWVRAGSKGRIGSF
jgi:hypothetical protein